MEAWHKRQQPAGIFMDSMSDMWGHWVPEEHILEVLDNCTRAEQHVFFSLTKNPRRIWHFNDYLPPNVFIGASSPPDSFMGKRLTQNQRYKMLETTLKALDSIEAPVRWLSIEPLSDDYTRVYEHWLREHDTLPINWVVIGAASKGKTYYQPHPDHIKNALDLFDLLKIPVFFKGNLRPSQGVAFDDWRENFPAYKAVSNG